MSELKPHLNLIELRSTVKQICIDLTNQYHIQNYKLSVHTEFVKGDGIIVVDKKNITEYYTFKLYLIDKKDKNKHETINLYTANYKPTSNNTFMIEETAIKDFLRLGILSLVNLSYTNYIQNQEKDADTGNTGEGIKKV
jgi:hypothetical protein